MIEILKALADFSRLRLVSVILRGEFTVQELTRILRMGQSRISRHLKILLEAGILDVKRQGTWSYYRVGDAPLFVEIRPFLEKRFGTLPGHGEDLAGLAIVFEERSRRSREFFDQHARQWDALAREVLPAADYLQPLAAAVPKCERLLEVGVGTGGLLAALKARAKCVVGVDHSPAMLEEARARAAAQGLEGVELRLGEMAHLPLSDGECQVALLNMVLHHAARPAEVLSELRRVLTPGGTLLIADLARHGRDWVRERLADQWLGFEREEISGWLAAAGFIEESYTVVPGEGEALEVFILAAQSPSEAIKTKIKEGRDA